jgi:iron(III) transport system substrate-binding protein
VHQPIQIARPSRRAFLSTAAAFSLAACAKPPSPKELTIYSGRGENLVGPLLTKAGEALGLEITVRYGNSAQMALTILEEGKNTRADLFLSQESGALGALARENRLTPLPEDILNTVDARFRSPAGLWVGLSGRTRVIDYNTTLVRAEELPDSIHGLTAPRWKNQVGWAPANGSFQAFVTALRLLEGEDKTLAWLNAMKANGAKSYPSNAPIVEALGRGEIQLGLTNNYYLYRFTAERPDFPVAHHYTRGDAGALVLVSGAAILDTAAERREPALAVLRYLLDTEAQTHFAEVTNEYPLVPGIPIPEGRTPLADLRPPALDLSRIEDLEGTMKLLTTAGLL